MSDMANSLFFLQEAHFERGELLLLDRLKSFFEKKVFNSRCRKKNPGTFFF